MKRLLTKRVYAGVLGIAVSAHLGALSMSEVEEMLQKRINVPDIINKTAMVLKQISFSETDLDGNVKAVETLARNIIDNVPGQLLGVNLTTIKQGTIPQEALDAVKRYVGPARETLAKIVPFLEYPNAAINALDGFYKTLEQYIPDDVKKILGDVSSGQGLMVLVKENREDFKNIAAALSPYVQKLDGMIAGLQQALMKNPTMNMMQAASLISSSIDLNELNKFANVAYEKIKDFVTKREVLKHLADLKTAVESINPAVVRSTVERAVKTARENIGAIKDLALADEPAPQRFAQYSRPSRVMSQAPAVDPAKMPYLYPYYPLGPVRAPGEIERDEKMQKILAPRQTK